MEIQTRIFDIIYKEDDVTWESVLMGLVKDEQMSPWDVDVSVIAKKYIEIIKQLHDLDFRVSGKMLLAAALLLKLKSSNLLESGFSNLDSILFEPQDAQPQYLDDDDYDGFDEDRVQSVIEENKLIPRTPQPRQRKVSLFDLVLALQKAINVKNRRMLKRIVSYNVEEHNVPDKEKVDITKIIEHLYSQITARCDESEEDRITFSELLPAEDKESKIYTFLPLLYLTNQLRIDLEQEEHFGEIDIVLNRSNQGPLKQIDE